MWVCGKNSITLYSISNDGIFYSFLIIYYVLQLYSLKPEIKIW